MFITRIYLIESILTATFMGEDIVFSKVSFVHGILGNTSKANCHEIKYKKYINMINPRANLNIVHNKL